MMKANDEVSKQLRNMEKSYNNALKEGSVFEQARWANLIAGIYMNAEGDHLEALNWFKTYYNIAVIYFSKKDLLPTCQSIGEVNIRLNRFSDALIYQRKHLEIARNMDDMVEQQRACTQLGRTYLEMFNKSCNQDNLRKARECFNASLKLGDTIKDKNKSIKYFDETGKLFTQGLLHEQKEKVGHVIKGKGVSTSQGQHGYEKVKTTEQRLNIITVREIEGRGRIKKADVNSASQLKMIRKAREEQAKGLKAAASTSSSATQLQVLKRPKSEEEHNATCIFKHPRLPSDHTT